MFIYDKNEGGVDVRRIENKLGIHGSPTCELVYKDAKAELCGDRKLGLIKYEMCIRDSGDTAQVGPQVAEKLGLSQITYTEEILNVDETARRITVKRHIDGEMCIRDSN